MALAVRIWYRPYGTLWKYYGSIVYHCFVPNGTTQKQDNVKDIRSVVQLGTQPQ
jgi:hypothetical protein